MSGPIVPNYINGVGRLVTDRFDFENHIDGYSFRHDASQIDLFPPVVVDGYVQTTLQDAVQTLSTYVVPPVIPDATTSSGGVIRLSGDLSGSATSVEVVGLRGYPVATLTPALNDVLSWDGTQWNSSAPLNNFTAGGDLYGSNVLQRVQSLTGDTGLGEVTVDANAFKFSSIVTPYFYQDSAVGVNGTNFIITGQASASTNFNAGNVIISGGEANGGGTALNGGVSLALAGGNYNLIQISELEEAPTTRQVVSLCLDSSITNAEMGPNTGNKVIYVADAATNPSAPAVGGSILYSSGGKLNITEADGTSFIIGTIPNPSIWGPTNQQVYTRRDYASSTPGSRTNVIIYDNSFPSFDRTAIKLDVIFSGRVSDTGVNEGYSANMSATFIVSAAGVVTAATGGPYIANISSLGAGWTDPVILSTAGDIIVRTGFSATRNVNWLVITQFTIVA